MNPGQETLPSSGTLNNFKIQSQVQEMQKINKLLTDMFLLSSPIPLKEIGYDFLDEVEKNLCEETNYFSNQLKNEIPEAFKINFKCSVQQLLSILQGLIAIRNFMRKYTLLIKPAELKNPDLVCKIFFNATGLNPEKGILKLDIDNSVIKNFNVEDYEINSYVLYDHMLNVIETTIKFVTVLIEISITLSDLKNKDRLRHCKQFVRNLNASYALFEKKFKLLLKHYHKPELLSLISVSSQMNSFMGLSENEINNLNNIMDSMHIANMSD